MKRIVLFLLTNLAIIVVLSVVLSALGVDRFERVLFADGDRLGLGRGLRQRSDSAGEKEGDHFAVSRRTKCTK